MASLMSDNGHMDVYSKPREQIWSHSYAQDVTIEQVLFGSKQAKEDPAAAAEYEQPEAVMYDFSEPGSYWQYCVTDVTGQPGEYQGVQALIQTTQSRCSVRGASVREY